ncbi:uncharacterized protein CLUP02_03815 [Colletotrichum lupini]|uniref:Uncharacterized protein n=1 Tax=Colletotrichum lupini TaxID=145971 RepID=A0A9Q8WC63_9PEZI|nr:uncharacterized protein CLUP02_03815 [Colletotrichum lupini]UQC78338.1 hypothetical protein CLUP02_03815 [Colletotrichum lupini]
MHHNSPMDQSTTTARSCTVVLYQAARHGRTERNVRPRGQSGMPHAVRPQAEPGLELQTKTRTKTNGFPTSKWFLLSVPDFVAYLHRLSEASGITSGLGRIRVIDNAVCLSFSPEISVIPPLVRGTFANANNKHEPWYLLDAGADLDPLLSSFFSSIPERLLGTEVCTYGPLVLACCIGENTGKSMFPPAGLWKFSDGVLGIGTGLK